MLVCPRPLKEVIESSPGTVENCRSRGVATEAAMVSGLAPGSVACTCNVGKSMFGRSLTGKFRYPATPNSRIPIMTRAVMTGRLMNSAVRFMNLLVYLEGDPALDGQLPSVEFEIH